MPWYHKYNTLLDKIKKRASIVVSYFLLFEYEEFDRKKDEKNKVILFF